MNARLLIISLCIVASLNLQATRRYVTPNGAGSYTGANWANACSASQIQQLINGSGQYDSIFVAAGVYKPTSGGNFTVSFELKNHAKLFGGFPLPSSILPNPTWANRNISLYPTAFSGDLQNNDINTDGNFLNQTADSIVGNNSHHLFTGNGVNSSCVIDGFIIVGGGGSVYGGAFYNYYYSSPTIRNCHIVGNQAQQGGAIYNYNYSSPSFLNCVIKGNSATSGGAIYNQNYSNPIITQTQILANHATQKGGAVYSLFAYPIFTNSVIAGNQAEQGGGFYCQSSPIILTGCVIYGNQAQLGGGAFNHTSSMTLNSCTVVKNEAIANGGGIRNISGANPKIRNSIIWGNIAPSSSNISNIGGCNTLNYNSIIENYGTTCHNCPNVDGNVNPQFTQINDGDGADNIWMTYDDGLRLKPCSPGINAGANQYLPATLNKDIIGRNRVRHLVTDLGAYECADFVGDGYLTTLNSANTQLSACEECIDANGWTHYYDTVSRKMVLAIFKNGYNIGQIGDGVFEVNSYTTANYANGTGTVVNAPYSQNLDWFVMNRWWDVTPNPQLPAGNTGVKVRTYFTSQDTADINGSILGGALNINQFRFYKINGGSASLDPNGDGNYQDAHNGVMAANNYHDDGYWEYVYSPTTSSTTTWRKGTFNNILFAEYEVAKFSGGGGGGAPNGGGAFPITLSSFDGNVFETGNVLNWWTIQEMAGGHFVVQRSKDGYRFEEIGDIQAVGNSLDQYQYSFFDENPFWGTNYYRLRLTDFEGYTEYSDMIELNFGFVSFAAYPNPAQNYIKIEGNFPDKCQIHIFDMAGTKVQAMPVNANITTELDINNLHDGVYYFQLRDENGEALKTQTVVVQN